MGGEVEMTDLISRAAAIKVFTGKPPEYYHTSYIVGELNCVPAVDAVPVVHARWTTKRTWRHDGEWYCSECEYEPVVFMDSAFCPNCGAKMDEMDNE